jgi:predicted phage tail protein
VVLGHGGQPDAESRRGADLGDREDGLTLPVLWGGGGGGKGGEGHTPEESPNDLLSRARARFLELWSEGEIVGLYKGGQSIFFGDTSLVSDQGEDNFTGVVWVTRLGTADQDPVPEASQLESVIPVSFGITHDTAFTMSFLPGDADSVRITLHVDVLFEVQDDGDIRKYHVELAFYRRRIGAEWEFLDTYTIEGKTNSPYEIDVRIIAPERDLDWELRVERWTPDDANSKKQSVATIPRVTKIIEERLSYPHSALIGIEIDAKKFGGSIPNRSYELLGLKINIPSNYDSFGRVYNGIWDGTFKVAWTNNPAWIFYDLLINDRYGLGRYINFDRLLLDKWALYEIGRYCDEMVDDGNGGLEPRFTINTVIHDAGDAYEVLNSVASAFRGMIYWAAGAVTAVQDSPRNKVKLFTTADVENGVFSYLGTALKSRHTVVFVRWNDPTQRYKQVVEPVEDQPRVAKYGWFPIDVTAYGCTSRAQARRFGLWMLDTEWTQTQTVTFATGLQGSDLMPGDVFAVSDPEIGGLRTGGRVKAVNGLRLTLDAPVPIEDGVAYSILATNADGGLEEIRFDAAVNPADIILLRSSPTAPIRPGMNFIITAQVLVPRLFSTLTVEETEENRYNVTGLFYDPDKFDRVEKGIVKPPPNYFFNGGLLPPDNLKLTSVVKVQPGGLIRGDATLSWSPPGPLSTPAVFFDASYKHDTDPAWTDLPRTSAVVVDLGDLLTGTYHFRVRSIDALGAFSDWATLDGNVSGTDAPPGDVLNFYLTTVGTNLLLSWDVVPDVDTSYYQIRYSPNVSNPTWTGAQTIIPRIPNLLTNMTLPALAGAYLIKAFDYGGHESVNPAVAVTDPNAVFNFNFIEQLVAGPTWSGAATDTEVVGSDLRLTESFKTYPPEGDFVLGSYVDLGSVYTCRLYTDIRASGFNPADVIADWQPLSSMKAMSTIPASTWNVRTFVSTTAGDPSVGPWDDWRELVVGDYTGRGFRFKLQLITLDPRITPAVQTATFFVDMPDRQEARRSVAVPVIGLHIAFTNAFRESPTVLITQLAPSAGDHYTISNLFPDGFDIMFFDNSGNPVSRTMNWVAIGFGRKS